MTKSNDFNVQCIRCKSKECDVYVNEFFRTVIRCIGCNHKEEILSVPKTFKTQLEDEA